MSSVSLYLTNPPQSRSALCVEGEGSTNLVVGLVELLGIEGSSNAEVDTRAEENVVGNSGNTTVVDLGLYDVSMEFLATDKVYTP